METRPRSVSDDDGRQTRHASDIHLRQRHCALDLDLDLDWTWTKPGLVQLELLTVEAHLQSRQDMVGCNIEPPQRICVDVLGSRQRNMVEKSTRPCMAFSVQSPSADTYRAVPSWSSIVWRAELHSSPGAGQKQCGLGSWPIPRRGTVSDAISRRNRTRRQWRETSE
jgi:hypothetical protein